MKVTTIVKKTQYNTQFDTVSYKIVRKVEYVSTYAPLACRWVSVPVHYDDYIPLTGEVGLSFGYIPSRLMHYRSKGMMLSNIQDKKLLDLLTTNNIQIKNGFISYNTNSNISNDVLLEVIKLIKAANNNLNSNKSSNKAE